MSELPFFLFKVGDILGEALKYFVIIFFFLACLYSHDEKINRYYTTASVEDDMNLIDSSVVLANGVSIDTIKRIETEIQKLPARLWKQYLLNGGRIEIVADDIADESESYVGSFSILDDTMMEIVVNEHYIEYSLCHEFSHYLFYIEGVTEKADYYLLLQEKDALWRDLLHSEPYFYPENEYFAEVGKYYFKGLIDEEKYPYTAIFFKNLMKEYE